MHPIVLIRFHPTGEEVPFYTIPNRIPITAIKERWNLACVSLYGSDICIHGDRDGYSIIPVPFIPYQAVQVHGLPRSPAPSGMTKQDLEAAVSAAFARVRR